MTDTRGPRAADVRAQRSPLRPRTIVVAVGGQLERADIPGLCERVRTLLERGDADLVVCDVGSVDRVDAVTVDVVARLQVAARRAGLEVRLRRDSSALRELLVFMGLSDVAPFRRSLGVESRGQAEEREQGRGVEEEVGPDDLTP